jgi:cyclic pyranopterin phosphate synthase
VRFIELMPTPGALDNKDLFISAREMKKRLDVLGKMEACMPEVGNGPAKYYRFPGAEGTVGFIAPVSEHFCERCNRIRLTSDGKLLPCLLSDAEIDIKTPLRGGADAAKIEKVMRQAVVAKPMQHNLGDGRKPKVHTMTEVGG